MTDNELIAKWYFEREGKCPVNFNPECDITDWHSNDGLLAEIKKRGKIRDFTRRLCREVDDIGIASVIMNDKSTFGEVWTAMWPLVDHEPAQLTAALVAVIKEEE